MQLPIALRAGQYGSIKDKGQLVNLIAETNKAKDYVTARRTEGLTLVHTTPGDMPVRSNFHQNGVYIYYVSDEDLYRWIPPFGAPASVGTVGGSGRAVILSNSVPG